MENGSIFTGKGANASSAVPLAAWGALSILVIFQILSYMDRLILNLLVLPIQQDLGLSDVQIGLLQGVAYTVFYAAAALPVAWLADRIARRLIIFFGVISWSIFTMQCGFSRAFVPLFLARAGVGASESTLNPAGFSLLTDLFPKSRLASAIGTFYFGGSAGSAVSLVLGGFLISGFQRVGGLTLPGVGHLQAWQATLFSIGAPGALLAFLIFLVREPQRAKASVGKGGWKEFAVFISANRSLLTCHFLGFSLLTLPVYAMLGWSAAYMGRRFAWHPAAIGIVLGVAVGLCSGLGNILGGRAADNMFKRGTRDAYFRLNVFTTLAAVPLLAGAFLVANVWQFVILFCLGNGIFTSFGASAAASLQLIAPVRLRAKLTALYLVIQTGIGAGIGPVLTAAITEHLLHDRQKVGTAVMIVVTVVAPTGALILWTGRRFLAAAIQTAENTG